MTCPSKFKYISYQSHAHAACSAGGVLLGSSILLTKYVTHAPCAVLVASLQAQLRQSQANQKLVTFCHFNADQCVDASRPVAVAWLPGSKGEAFLAAHSSGNVYVYQKARASPCHARLACLQGRARNLWSLT